MARSTTLGKVVFTPRGTFSPTVVYSPLDIISYNGSSYIVLQECINRVPPNANFYQEIASKGDTGSAGAAATVTAGTATALPVGSAPTVTNGGSSSAAVLNFGIPQGSVWYAGTAITGTTTTGRIFTGSGIANAGVGDMYLNTGTDANGGNVYRCTTAGAPSTARWAYVTSIKGTMANTVAYTAQSDKTTAERTIALSNVGIHVGSTAPESVTTDTVPIGEFYAYIGA